MALDVLYHLVPLTKHKKLQRPFELIPFCSFCAFITWHIVDADGLLKVLVVCHHL